ncbi:MAG: hypothetical protein JXA33_14405 [Anaerolineae bacterium]|nr:hypothetical protein [Anaerolineae bacterium]
MDLKTFFTKGWPTRLAFLWGKYFPPRAGRHVAAVIARGIVTLKPSLYWVTRDNLRHVLGPEASEKDLKRAVYRLFVNAVRGYYELFHNVGRGETRLERFRPPVHIPPETVAMIQQALDTGRGVLILGCHMSNFDLAGIALSQCLPVPAQALSLAHPPPGFELFNQLRLKAGNGVITPITPASLRDAIQRLRAGGIVMTGVDRPVAEGCEPVEFFGATAHLPVGYIRIPLMVDCWVIVLSFIYENHKKPGDGVYRVIANPPMEMVRTGSRAQDIQVNLRRVLTQVEDFIRRAPDQWMMFVPVWKDNGES